MIRLRDALLKRENVNVITTDWSDEASKNYISASKSGTRTVGVKVGDLIMFLLMNAPSSGDLVHIVGFSLGAHVAGFAGQQLRTKHGIKLGRITGKPLFLCYVHIYTYAYTYIHIHTHTHTHTPIYIYIHEAGC